MTRVLILLAVMLTAPLAVYWQTVFYEFGFRDDYAHLREAHEEPGKLFKLTSSNGRPVYGAVLEASLQQVRAVPDLPWLRLSSVILLTAVGLALWWLLRRSGWAQNEAAAMGLAVTLLPGAQITVGWAIAWPITLALLLAVLGFALVEASMSGGSRLRCISAFAGGAFCYFLAGLTYQSSALFAVTLLAALLLLRSDRQAPSHVRWIAAHIGTLFASLVAGFLLMQIFFTEGVVVEAARMRLEPDPLLKLLWFVRQPLVNAVALFELRDRFHTSPAFWAAAATFAAIAALGFRFGGKSRSHQLRWLFCLLVLPFIAHSVSLAASSQAIGYRTMFPLSGLFLVLVIFALRSLVAAGRIRPALQHAALALLLVFAAFAAHRNAFTLIAEPQSREWELVQSAAHELRLESDTDIYIIRPNIEDRSTEQVFDDEFGSLSSDADWASKEMFKAAMRERYPESLPPGYGYSIETGFAPPQTPSAYDLVLDLRKLKEEGDREPGVAVASGTDPSASRR